MKISRLEFVALLLAAVFAAFAAGWFSGQAAPQPVRVETERTLTQETPWRCPRLRPPLRPEQGGYPCRRGEDQPQHRRGGRADDPAGHRGEAGGGHHCLPPGQRPFRIPEELTEVPGIGEGILEGLIDYVTTGEENR